MFQCAVEIKVRLFTHYIWTQLAQSIYTELAHYTMLIKESPVDSLTNKYSRHSPVQITLIHILANPNTHDFNGLRMHIIFVWIATGNSKKMPHKTLTIDEKVEILEKIGKKSYNVVSEEYSIGCATT